MNIAESKPCTAALLVAPSANMTNKSATTFQKGRRNENGDAANRHVPVAKLPCEQGEQVHPNLMGV